ncbi:MAG: lipase family protein [Gordonia sp. (in: high G+C Gram-positive bacteria)]|uniref:lipase family protein n=1 Tax=Gordonia sp. (in: high G+C Gram-positive bacteria) TaxID=84139 RepID=UPI0039E23DC2
MLRRALAALGATALLTTLPVVTAPAHAAARGDVISAVDITADPDSTIDGAARVISVKYLSEDAKGQLVPVQGSVSIPKRAPGRAGYRILSWNHSTVGLGDRCGLSRELGSGGKRDPWLGPWLKDGYVISATDYAGIGSQGDHAYLDGEVAGKNVIDMVRATRTVVDRYSDHTASNAFVPFGGSQGGHTSLWAGHLAKRYAPELKVAGTIAHSVPSGLPEYFSTIRPGFPPAVTPDHTTYFTYVLAGLKQVHPEAQVDSYLTPQGRALVEAAKNRCYEQQNAATRGISVGSLVTKPLADGPLIPALRTYARVPVKGFQSPVLLQQGTADLVAFQPLTDELVAEMRGNGVQVDYRTYPESHGLTSQRVHEARAWANALKTWPRG